MGSVFSMGRHSYAQAVAPNQDVIYSVVASHSIATGNSFYATESPDDWYTVYSTLDNSFNEWNDSGRDASLRSAISQVSPSQINSGNINKNAALSTLRLYQPQFVMADVDYLFNVIDGNPSLIPGTLAQIQAQGMAPFILTARDQSVRIAQLLTPSTAPGGGGGGGDQGMARATGTLRARAAAARATPNILPHPAPELPMDPSGGGGYNCQTDGALILGATLAFATIAVMTMGTGVLVGAAWAGIATWGGLGTAGWSAGHVIAGCGF